MGTWSEEEMEWGENGGRKARAREEQDTLFFLCFYAVTF